MNAPDEPQQPGAPGRPYYLIVRGPGSWTGGNPPHTYREGVHEISAQVAAAVLAFKHKHPTPWFLLTDTRPELMNGSLSGPLLEDDLQPGAMPDGIRLLREEENSVAGPANRNDVREASRHAYACQHCSARFPSAAAAKRHLRHNHVFQPEKVEARIRAQLDAEREHRTAQPSTQNADDAAAVANRESRTARAQ